MVDENGEYIDCDESYEVLYMENGHLPYGFRDNAIRAMGIARDTIVKYTDQKFQMVSCKLSPLTSGKGNIAMFVYFPDGCPFVRQEFLVSDKFDDQSQKMINIRVIPNPIINPSSDYMDAYMFKIKFIDVDKKLYDMAFPLIRHAIETTMKNANLRYIKPNNKTNELVGVFQLCPDDSNDIDKFMKALANINFNPYIETKIVVEKTIIM
jgi:hypothetical protein